MSFTINRTPQPSSIRRPVQFGQGQHAQAGIDHSAQNIVWVTTERLPAKVGGLGEVSKTIPESIAEHLPKKDVRVVVPYLQQHRDADQKESSADKRFKPTGVHFNFAMEDGSTAKVEVLEKFEYATGHEGEKNQYGRQLGNHIYALKCDPYFIGKDKTGQEQGLGKYTYTPNAGEFDKVMLFNRAAAELVPLLDGNNKSAEAQKLPRFSNPLKKDNTVQTEAEKAKQGNFAQNKDPGNIDLVVAHDWLSGPILNELADKPNTKKIFMVHNKYDKVQPPDLADRSGLVTPQRLYDREENFSALRVGIEPADGIIVNDNFKDTLLKTHLADGERFIKSLRKKDSDTLNNKPVKRTFNMHHGLSVEVTPSGTQVGKDGKLIRPAFLTQNYSIWLKKQEADLQKKMADPAKNGQAIQTIRSEIDFVKNNLIAKKLLDEKGALKPGVMPFAFKPLELEKPQDIPTAEQMEAYKRANKIALQRKLGLKEDPDAILMGWAARLEPRQKGSFLLQKTLETILTQDKYKNVQFVLYGDTPEDSIKQWMQSVNQKYGSALPAGERRVFMPNKFADQDTVKQMNAACDFTILPSLYEPYGLTQLEAMKMGSIPIVHGVDGLRTTVNDPEMVAAKFKPGAKKHEKVWRMPQNGVLMEPVDIDRYGEYVNRKMAFDELEALYGKLNAPAEAGKKGARLASIQDVLLSSAKNRIHLRKLAEADQRNQMKRPYNLDQRIKAMTQEAEALLALRAEVEQHNAVSPELFLKIKKQMDPAEDPAKNINDVEARKLTDAIERAIRLKKQKAGGFMGLGSTRKDTQIRLNGLQYVNKEHKWEKLIKEYYKSVFEESSIDQASRTRHSAELDAYRKAQKIQRIQNTPVYQQNRPGKETEPTGLIGQIRWVWDSMMRWNERFWRVIGRTFSLRKD